ncbi:MAG: hypothetical protein E7480_05370 [Ruminococcaceae bacterium]|nr:hypothetical protein [Oscillospiraceae bacterium]
MKKRMLALAVAVLMIVSVFAAMPISAASANLSLSVESVETEGGRLVTVYAQSAEALLAGYHIELTDSDGASIITEDVVDPNGDVETYKDVVLANEVAGLATSVDENGVVSFVYAGFVDNGENIEEIADIDISSKTALFSFYVDVTAEEGTTGIAPVVVSKSDMAFADESGYALFTTDVAVETFDTVVPFTGLEFSVTGATAELNAGDLYEIVINLANYDANAPIVDGFMITLDVDANFAINEVVDPEGEVEAYQDIVFADALAGKAAGYYNAETGKLVILFDGVDAAENTAETLAKGTTEIATIKLVAKEVAEETVVENVVAINDEGTTFVGTDLVAIAATGSVNAAATIAAPAPTGLESVNGLYAIDNDNFTIKAVRPMTTVEDFIAEVPAAADAIFTDVYGTDIAEAGSYIGTGSTVEVNGNVYYVVVYGDLDGDGDVIMGADDAYVNMIAENALDPELGMDFDTFYSDLGLDPENEVLYNCLFEAIELDLDGEIVMGADDAYLNMAAENFLDAELGYDYETLLVDLGILDSLGLAY